MTKKSGYHHGDLHQALLEAGDSVLRDVGLRQFTLRECARRANVSHAAPKHHFGDVQGLLTEIAAGGFRRLTNHLREEMDLAESLQDEFAATTRAYLKFAVENPEHFRIMFRSDLVNEHSTILRDAANETYIELTNVIHRQRSEPEMSAGDPNKQRLLREIANDIVISWSHIHGFAHLVLEQQLNMVEASEYETLIVTMAERLSGMLQGDAQKS